jgi:hypothetical protein
MKICRNCNQSNPTEAMFCRQCASPLDAAPQAKQQQYANPPQNQQQQWNQPNYGNQGVQQNFAQTSGAASSRAMAAVGLAAVGFLCCFVSGVPAAILGWLEMSAIKEGKSSPAGMMMAQIGLWGGIVGAIINAFCWFFLMLIGSLGGGGY